MVKEAGENFEIASRFARMKVTKKNENKKLLKKNYGRLDQTIN